MSREPTNRRKRTPKNREPLLSVLLNPFYWPSATLECLEAWIYTRRWMQLLIGTPVAVAIFAFWICAEFVVPMESNDQMRNYLREAIRSKDSNQQPQFELACRRLLSIPMTDADRFRVALTLLSKGDLQRSEQQVSIIAPENGVGYGEAHQWMAAKLLSEAAGYQSVTGHQSVTDDQAKLEERLIHHALAAYQQMPDSPRAQAIWGQILMKQGNELGGLAMLERASDKLPEINLLVARIHAKMGNQENLNRFVERSEQYFRSLIIRDSTDLQSRSFLVQTLILKNDMGEAVQVAEEGFRKSPSPGTKQLLLETFGLIYDALPPDERLGLAGLNWIRKGLDVEPRDRNALQRLVKFITLETDAQWEVVRGQLEREIAVDNVSAMTRMILAIGFCDHQDKRASQFQVQQAVIADRAIAFFGGNVALIAIEMDSPELRFAENWLEVLSLAMPNRNELTEVRGRLFMAEGKYAEAIADLEAYLSQTKSTNRVRALLREAYEKLGQPEKANQYRDEATSDPQESTSEDNDPAEVLPNVNAPKS